MDGYAEIDIVSLICDQLKVKGRIIAIHKEISLMPKAPRDSESWISSIPDLESSDKRFSIKDLKKMSKLRREMKKLGEQEESNKRKMKIYDLNALLKKIDDIDK